ncbi:hypothetical protein PML80_06810 [Aerococcus urinaeequi]|uniref:O-antigen ligase family protein n=1 Tax=Aerococcus urinaeequi TaxID=51665 RepID=A0AAE9XGX6_9LACT|nr:hypothetical protein [Aerococcus urinaeequi]WCG37234.1 hypothetical protein PML80_06810 [Aerococcus urinaeequi]
MINNIDKKNIFSLLIGFFYLFWIIFLINGSQIFSIIQFILSLLILILFIQKKDVNRRSFIFISIFTLIFIINNLINRNLNLIGIFFNLQFSFIALGLANFELDKSTTKLFYNLHVIIFLFFMITGSDPNTIFAESSRNTISVIMLIQTALLYFSKYKIDKNISIIPAVITLAISLWGVGRSGILSAFVLLLFILLSKNLRSLYKTKFKVYRIIPIIAVIIAIFTFLMTNYADDIGYYITYGLERFEQLGFEEDIRGAVIKEFFENIDSMKSLVLGPDLKEVFLINLTNNNLHNSYLRLYAYYGLLGIILFSSKVILSTKNYLKIKNHVYLGLLLAILLRISTDSVAFPGHLDPIIYFLILNTIDEEKIHDYSV